MAKEIFPKSQLPVRKTAELLPRLFNTEANRKFMAGSVDPLVQPGILEKTVGYIGRRYGKTYNSKDVYLDTDNTLRSRYQLEPGVIVKQNDTVENFYDYLDFKNQLKFFENTIERDDLTTSQDHYSWNPPIDWDKFINFREYYWIPEGPPPINIYGEIQPVTSTYTVMLGTGSVFIFTPDGLTNNPTLTLYRGQTYKFKVNVPGNNFVIRRTLDTGNLLYNPILPYSKGQIVVYDGKVFQAKETIGSQANPTPLDQDSRWEKLTVVTQNTFLDYNDGVENNGIENGFITFTVPYDAPDVLFYQSFSDPNKFGKFIIDSISANTFLDVEKEILGKVTYKSSNGIEFSNGMLLRFEGQVVPEQYSRDSWLVEGVGSKITLTRFNDLFILSPTNVDNREVSFDNSGFDILPFDDVGAYSSSKDYLTINRSSVDRNPWSRYNRWFHKSVLEYSHQVNQTTFDASEDVRAKRPIIEFKSNLQLFNHGQVAKTPVDFVDDFTTDVFSTFEGSKGFFVDSEAVFEGARILFTADTDNLVKNKIYTVKFITHKGNKQVSLIETPDSEPIEGTGILVLRGKSYRGTMLHYNGEKWVISQSKLSVNQFPLFDLFDENEKSFGDTSVYPVSTFTGCEIISYKIGNSIIDSELGISLSYLNIDNVGDIQFEFDFETAEFFYEIDQDRLSKRVSTGYYRFSTDDRYENGWIQTDPDYLQPIIESITINEETNKFTSLAVNWRTVSDSDINKILIYLNGTHIRDLFTRSVNIFTFDRTFSVGDVVTLKVFVNAEPDRGYYEIPVGLEKNPLNQNITTFTLGQASDHVRTALEFVDNFSGTFPGNNNLRDLDDYQSLGKQFLKHSGITPLSILLLCDKDINIIKSIQYAKQAYSEFKNTFLKLAVELTYNQDPVEHVDLILEEISRSKNSQSPFFQSDMIGSGAYTQLEYVVEDIGIKSFALSEKFDLDTLSNRAVYAYINNQQLIFGKDYEFNSAFGFIRFNVEFSEGDRIVIREYLSTANNFIPPTPTKLGLYKKFLPQKFIDDTYIESREVIQGHDGSITAAYDDYRDDILLELEFRIYNNIKQKYDESVFNNDNILGGYYNSPVYNKSQVDSIIASDFLRWVSKTNVDYINNTYFDTEEPFTYTYSNMTDPTGTQNLPGYWRGVYQWFYDTDRPHRCPWEMLGFSEMPEWWEDEYGPTPYTSNNLILWEDLRGGIIRQGDRAGTYQRYKRPSILDHVPVDGDGKLLDPLTSGLAGNFVLINNRGNFKFGDISPVEYAWRSSSEYPFSIISALCLLKPFEYISDNYNKSQTVINKLSQTVNIDTGLFFNITDLISIQSLSNNVSGLYLYVVNYVKSRSFDDTIIDNKIQNIDVLLSNRTSGFIDQQQQKYLLDSKNPRSTTSSIFIPPENYDIIFDVSCPILNISYSGVVLEKVNSGWKVGGYDALNPAFKYFKPVPSQSDPLIKVGGVSEPFVEWKPETVYANGALVRYLDTYYRSLRGHTSSGEFDKLLWQELPGLPIVGAVEAFRRRTFNKLKIQTLPYSYIFNTIQDVVDFLLGYYEYQLSIGIVFSGYDVETQTSFDWVTSVKEFMFWTKHNWAEGSLISLSPLANRIEITVSVGVADNILDSFYDYQVLKTDGTPIDPKFINISRDYRKVVISTTNTTEGIFFLKLYFVLKEHVVLFDDRTVFNDVIYDKPTGYRQNRIKVRGFRTTDWDGDYTSPGFLFDNVNITAWQPFVDYKLGDIVNYRSISWTSINNQIGTSEFNPNNWSRLDLTPSKGLVANFDYKIEQFSDYFEVESDGLGSSQREMARHSLGYQKRDYLQNLAEDEVTQFRLYQGFIREKGTSNSITKVFDKLNTADQESVQLNEEWAFRIGRFGGVDQNLHYEFRLDKSTFEVNPQPIFIEGTVPLVDNDQYVRITRDNFLFSPGEFSTDINPKSIYKGPSRNAGYVNLNDVEFILPTRDDLLNVNIANVFDNDHFWITFDNGSWTVLRYNEQPSLPIISIETNQQDVTLSFNRPHNQTIGDIVGIRNIVDLSGFFKIKSTTLKSFTIERSTTGSDIELIDRVFSLIGTFSKARYSTYDDLQDQSVALLKENSKVWIDDNSNNRWEVIEKLKRFISGEPSNYGIIDPLKAGTSVVYIKDLKQIITGLPGSNLVVSFIDRSSVDNVKVDLRQLLPPPLSLSSLTNNSFGNTIAVSPDNKWLAIGSPATSGAKSRYKGLYDPNVEYFEKDLVLDFTGKLWEAINNVPVGDGSTFNLSAENWKPASIVLFNPEGDNPGYTNQGAVTLYFYQSQNWVLGPTILSPRQQADEFFGSAISIGVDDSNYYMAVSSKDSAGSTGHTYLFYYNGTSWSNLENSNYVGLYDPIIFYPINSIVWYENNLYQAVRETVIGEDVSQSSNWTLIDPTSTSNALPTSSSINDDSSMMLSGLLSQTQLSELIKEGDGYGHAVAMNRDASILVVSAPYSDGQFFDNYRGVWKSYQEYVENDVVRYQNDYYILVGTVPSKNNIPSSGSPWLLTINDSGNFPSGKIFIYRRNEDRVYDLIQTINTQSLDEISTLGNDVTISSGDQFGFSIDIDWVGSTIVVSSPQEDRNYQNQGSVYVFELEDFSEKYPYKLVQVLQSFENYGNELFGFSVSISPRTEKIAVGAENSPFFEPCGFETDTTFDFGTTTFSDFKGFSGSAYVFEKKPSGYLLAEKLQGDQSLNESFGYSIDCVEDSVVVGSPFFVSDSVITGKVRLFKSINNENSLKIIRQEEPLIDIELFNGIEIYDEESNIKIADIDVIDPFKLKILSLAEREISFKTPYDPAVYMFGTIDQTIDSSQAWFEKNVGKLWWDLSTVKFLNYEQSDEAYRIGNWGSQVVGSSIDVYEWVESQLLPSEWNVLADTTEGLALGISGEAKFSDDTVYNRKIKVNPNTGATSGTLYYYWVKNSSVIPTNSKNRFISSAGVAELIRSPIGSTIPFIGIIDSNKFLAFNLEENFLSDFSLVSIQYKKSNTKLNNVHNEYQLLTEGIADSLPNASLEQKWIDSLLGVDEVGNRIPDTNLPIKTRYGVSFRPRQSMFVNKFKALEIAIDNINNVLTTRPFADLINFRNLNEKDLPPNKLLNDYDLEIDTDTDLQNVGTVKIKQALLRPNLVNGELDTIDIIDPGFGYRTTPIVEIEGTGENAEAEVTIDSQGRISSAVVVRRGRKYSSMAANLRPFSVLVNSDSSANGFWTIYAWDDQRKNFYRRKTQSYDVTKYWSYSDWWKEGFDESSKITVEIKDFNQEPFLNLVNGDLLRLKEFGSGGWAILEKVDSSQGDILGKYRLVGRENGTIQFDESLYRLDLSGIGFDTSRAYDTAFYDLSNSKELRIIFKAIKEDIFLEDLRVEWNKLFFNTIRYAFSEQTYVDWAFKTSFLNAIHNVGDLEKKTNYKNDNLDSYRQYIEEVKPFRTTLREFTSRYTRIENTPTIFTDFDLPPSYSESAGEILPVNNSYDRFDEYPWRWWKENNGFSIVKIEISNPGSGYVSPPRVLIEGNGSGAVAEAYISNGRVSAVRLTSGGSGYTETPTITLIGGNDINLDVAKAVAVLGDSKARLFNTTLKFDRISKHGSFDNLQTQQTFNASGASSSFDLLYAPSYDKTKVFVYKNQELVLQDQYSITFFNVIEEGRTVLKAKLIFNSIPLLNDVIRIEYTKNDSLLDSVDRINNFYAPVSGMLGKELNQLMTGIDFGGVQIQGTTFDVTGGWDALPWFTDNWDSVESSSDFYYTIVFSDDTDSSKIYKTGALLKYQNVIYKALKENINSNDERIFPVESLGWEEFWERFTITLPRIPEVDEIISIYVKRNGNDQSQRIDDPYFDLYDGSTIQPNGRTTAPPYALMNSFIGDGVTNTIDLNDIIDLNSSDTVIFRTNESDGSVTIADVNILDTRISGGTLETLGNAYVNATGRTPEEIIIDGEKFISPDQVPAPEENVPGQVLDSVSIKVYNTVLSGAAPLQNNVYFGDNNTTNFDIGLKVFESLSVLVYVDKVRKNLDDDYNINYFTNQVEFLTPISTNSVIEILSIGVGGTSLIDYQEFTVDGDTSNFVTKALYDQTGKVLVSVDGESIDTNFINSSELTDTENRTMIQLGFKPFVNQIVKIICFGKGSQIDLANLVRINEQKIIFDGVNYSYNLDNFVDLESASTQASILVDVNGSQLINVDTIYEIYDGTNSNISLGVDPEETPGSITSENIKVYVNGELKSFIVDYIFDTFNKTISMVEENLVIGDIIRIEVDLRSQYEISGSQITLATSVPLSQGDIITVTWFSNYPEMNLISDQYSGGKALYKLSRTPLSSNYVWVYKNGQRLSKDIDYAVSIAQGAVTLKDATTTDDLIKIVEFASNIYDLPSAYEIYKDMLNNFYYKRYSKTDSIRLDKPLNYYDTTIEVTNGNALFDPIPSRNIPGVIIINSERIEYLSKTGNTLGQLRRGSLGTGIAVTHDQGSYVINVGPSESIPYTDTQEKTDFVSDGSTILIGPLEFIPRKFSRTSWFRGEDPITGNPSIPEEFGPCDEIEVFVGGRRLRKDPVTLYSENEQGFTVDTEAEFSVDGTSPYIRLSKSAPAGLKIVVIRKRGKLWYDQGTSTATTGITFLQNTNEIVEFISQKGSELPE